MNDLDQRILQWRQELEATLAFSTEEIDELEDHLRFSIEAKTKQGAALEQAWEQSLGDLGSASALAVEFAKQKLLPALWRLLVAWWKPACLLVLFAAAYGWSFSVESVLASPEQPPPSVTASRTLLFWATVCTGILFILIFLPVKSHKNAVLAGVGNAFGLIPLLHVVLYNSITEKWIGPGWMQMAASFGLMQVVFGLAALVVINAWWWRHSASSESRRLEITTITLLVLIFAFSPVAGELIGNLSIREVYRMPTPTNVIYTGETLNHFLQWKFVDVLMESCIYITNFLPFSLIFFFCVGTLILQLRARKSQANESIFPSPSSLPWIMALVGSGAGWVVAHAVEPSFSEQVRQAERSVYHSNTLYGGLEITVLFSAAIFFISGWELMKQLSQAARIRSFYAWLLVMIELFVAVFVAVLANLLNAFSNYMGQLVSPPIKPNELSPSSQPEWLSWMLGVAILAMALYQSLLIIRKQRAQNGPISLWKFEGEDLVQMGLVLGLVYASSWLILTMVAIVMAYESVSVISAMIAWGNWIKYPAHNQFHPQLYGTPEHLAFWVACTITYFAFCLVAGLFTVIVLSGLEFIRFNAFRLYKVRRIRQVLAQSPAPLPKLE